MTQQPRTPTTEAAEQRDLQTALLYALDQMDAWTGGPGNYSEVAKLVRLLRAAIRSAAQVEPTDSLDAALERERDLRAERVETAKYHVAHDGTVRHPDGCNDCRALAERSGAPVEPT